MTKDEYLRYNARHIRLNKIRKILHIKTLGVDDWFGEEDLVLEQKRTFTVVCESQQGELMKIPKNVVQLRIMYDLNSQKNLRERVNDKIREFKAIENRIRKNFDEYGELICEDRKRLILRHDFEIENSQREQFIEKFLSK